MRYYVASGVPLFTGFPKKKKKEKKKMRERWRPDWQHLDDSGASALVRTGLVAGVRPATVSKYGAAYMRFIDFLVQRSYSFDLASLRRFLWAVRRQGASATTLEGYRSAVLWVQRAAGMASWADDPILIRVLAGLKLADKMRRVPRGAITAPMLRQLMRADPERRLLYATAFYGVLRRGQARLFRFGDVIGSSDGVTMTVRTDKRARRGNAREACSSKEVVHPSAQAFLLRLSAAGVHGERVFSDADVDAASVKVRAAAVELGWPRGVEFDGLHALRHGGAQYLKTYLATLVARMGDPAAMAPRTQRWYTRLNVLRRTLDDDDDYRYSSES
jgi:hypothetical protein